MADEVRNEELRIEPYYQSQGKYLTDTLFDLGCLSDSLSRDGIKKIEDLVALMFQQIADSAARCSGFTKKYKEPGHNEAEQVRHEEEMRWIARAKEAETRVEKLESFMRPGSVQWAWDAAEVLKKALEPPFGLSGRENYLEASRLLLYAIELGIIPEPDCRPGKIILCPGKIAESEAPHETEGPARVGGNFAVKVAGEERNFFPGAVNHTKAMTKEDIARTTYNVNAVYCASLGDYSFGPWEEAPEWQKAANRAGVDFHLCHPEATASASHESWFAQKVTDGWKYGPKKDPAKKEHPCMVPFDRLPRQQQAKEHIFRAVVDSLRGLL